MIYSSLVTAVVGERVKRSKLRSMWTIKALVLLPAGLGLVHQEMDFMEPGFDFGKLEVVKEIKQRSKECPHVMEKVTIFGYDWMDKNGKVIKDTLGTKNVFEEETNSLVYSDGSQDLIVLHQRLNCLYQDDQLLVDTIKDKLLRHPWPSLLPDIGLNNPPSVGLGLYSMLCQRYLDCKNNEGIFVELASSLGETTLSKTLHFEDHLH